MAGVLARMKEEEDFLWRTADFGLGPPLARVVVHVVRVQYYTASQQR